MKQPRGTICSVQGNALGLNSDNKFTVWSQVGSQGEAFGIWPMKAVGESSFEKEKRNGAPGSKIIDYIHLNCF